MFRPIREDHPYLKDPNNIPQPNHGTTQMFQGDSDWPIWSFTVYDRGEGLTSFGCSSKGHPGGWWQKVDLFNPMPVGLVAIFGEMLVAYASASKPAQCP